MKIYSIKNEKLGFFNRPIYCENDAEVLSYIQNVLMSDADRALLGLKDDLSLYCVGEWESSSGSIIGTCIDDEINGLMYGPVKICDLRQIFDTIPADKVPRSERELRDLIASQSKQIAELKTALATLKVDKKGNVTHE